MAILEFVLMWYVCFCVCVGGGINYPIEQDEDLYYLKF